MTVEITGNPVIYKITSKNNVYIGATTNYNKRKSFHTSNIASIRRGETQPDKFLYEQISLNNFEWNMEMYKEFPCKTRTQLNKEADRVATVIGADINANTSRKKKPEFSNSVVYTIRSRNNLYVGSTTNYRLRKKQHEQKIIRGDDTSKLYQKIKENNNEWEMKIYRRFQCTNSPQLRMEEEKVRELLKADLNSMRASHEAGTNPIENATENIVLPEVTKDKKTTIYKITAKRYAFLGFTDDFEEEKKTHTENALLFQRGRLMFHNVLCERLNMADFDWNIEIHSEFDYSTQSDIDLELERIRLQLEKTGDFDYVDTRARQIIYREQEISMINDPNGWAADVQTLPELPKLFFKRRQGTFYNFNGTKVFWYGRDINCEHNTVKHKLCRHCLYNPLNNKKTYLRDIDYYKHVEEQRYVRRQT